MTSPTPTTPVPRLQAAADIRAAFRARNVAHGSCMTVYARQRHDAAPARATVIAGRRVGGAVLRNRAKRRLRAALAGVALPAGFDLAIVAGSGALSTDFPDLQRQLTALVDRCARRAGAAA